MSPEDKIQAKLLTAQLLISEAIDLAKEHDCSFRPISSMLIDAERDLESANWRSSSMDC